VLLSFVPSHVLTQGIQDAFPDPAASPGVEVVTDRTLRREVVGQGAPGTAILVHIKDGIDNLARVHRTVSPATGWWGQEGFQQRPLGLGQIRRIGPPGTHAGSPGIKADGSPPDPSVCHVPSRLSRLFIFSPAFLARCRRALRFRAEMNSAYIR